MRISIPKFRPRYNKGEVFFYKKTPVSFFMFDPQKSSRPVGEMYGYTTIHELKPSFYIPSLIVYKKRQGYGTKFINLAKQLSKKEADGSIYLFATTNCLDPHNPPHQFYRKQGFSANDKKMLKRIDKANKKNQELDPNETPQLLMFYNPKYQNQENKSLWKKVKNYFELYKSKFVK